MRTKQLCHESNRGWVDTEATNDPLRDAQLVFVSGERTLLDGGQLLEPLHERFPEARIVAISSGGEIAGDRVLDGSAVATAIRFEHSRVHAVEESLADADESGQVARRIGRALPTLGLRHVLVFAEGLAVNGSALASGLAEVLPAGVTVSGGLAGDGERFVRTVVGLDASPQPGRVVAVGLYGDRLGIGMGSLGGWETFGPSWMVTRSSGNVLIELDGKPALPTYRQQIGPYSYALPASGLLFPIHLEGTTGGQGNVRTLLSIDDERGSLTFAGDVPEGRRVRLMRASLDRLIDASGAAAQSSLAPLAHGSAEFVLLISCIGRKLLLQRRVEEEIRSARRVFGPAATFAGFYSYGELSPLTPSARCELHNQTMTITALSEH